MNANGANDVFIYLLRAKSREKYRISSEQNIFISHDVISIIDKREGKQRKRETERKREKEDETFNFLILHYT